MIPAKGWLFVERVETDDRYGSLVIPDSARERMAGWQYTVLAVGEPLPLEEDEYRTEHDFQPGDWILSPPRRTMISEEEGIMLMARNDVWAVIE